VVARSEVVFVEKYLRLVASREATVQFTDELGAEGVDPLAAVRVSVAEKDVEIVFGKERHDFGATIASFFRMTRRLNEYTTH
jgi:hypothetical protein